MTALAPSTPLKCSQPACTIGTNGQCLEGLAPGSCPHRIEVDVSGAQAIVAEHESPSKSTVQLRLGKELQLDECGDVLASRDTRVIAIVGANDTGKTTLLGSLFDRFCHGSFGGYDFAGSMSLRALDERMYLGHTRCRAPRADTIRTKHDWEIKFLHIRLQQAEATMAPLNLLISDIPGETCKQARHSTDKCKILRPLLRADRLVVAVDGAKLATAELRESAIADSVALLRRMSESDVLRSGIHIDIVLTKWDIVKAANAEMSVRAAVDRHRNVIERKQFASSFSISWNEIAARPEDISVLQHCFGMDSLPRQWCESAPPRYRSSAVASPRARLAMDNYLPPDAPGEVPA